MALDVTMSGGELHAGVPQKLFVAPFGTGAGPRSFAIDPAGRRVLLPAATGEQMAAPITVVLNWAAGLRK